MKWSNTFKFKDKNIYYNRIRFGNPSERCVEISIGFDFLASLPSKIRILEVGNVLSHYENTLSEYIKIRNRKIIDKFESELGVEQWDLMDMSSSEQYDAIISISTVEHIGQGVEPSGSYGETFLERDLEAPLKAICKIYELLSVGGKALITVPFGKLIDASWFIQFSREYLQLLTSKYALPKSAISRVFLKKVDMQRNGHNPYQLWEETEESELEKVEYNWPFPCANAIAVVELNKVAKDGSLKWEIVPRNLVYNKLFIPKLIYKSETDFQLIKIENEGGIKETIIIIDGVFFQLYGTGIARLWRSLLQQWTNTEFVSHIIVLDRANTSPKIPGIRYRQIPSYKYNNTDADKQMLQQICDEEGADLFISTYYTTPISTPSVFMAYDMTPEVLGANFNEPMWREKHYAIGHASSYISISESTARNLVKFFPDITPDEVTVAHCGVATTFTPATTTEISAFQHKYGISKPYFLLVGAGGHYKNAILFFRAFAQLHSKQAFEIVCTGSGVTLANEYRQDASGSVVHSLILSDEELKVAYSGAVALVYPSLYEGFGMPVAEALACACPVITCANASIPEVAGEAAIYVDANDVDGLTDALCEMQKPKVRNSLIAAGLEQAKKFSWGKMADIMSTALMKATLGRLNLRDINLIIFPDWSQPEETVGLELQKVMKNLVTHPDRAKMTLLIDNSNITAEDADLILSSVAMNLLMEEELEVDEGPEIVLVGELSQIQWSALIPQLQGRIQLEHENEEVIASLKTAHITTLSLSDLANS